jgi:hypothetical protein
MVTALWDERSRGALFEQTSIAELIGELEARANDSLDTVRRLDGAMAQRHMDLAEALGEAFDDDVGNRYCVLSWEELTDSVRNLVAQDAKREQSGGAQ